MKETLKVSKTLAYYSSEFTTAVNSFIMQALGCKKASVCAIKLFCVVEKTQNKLDSVTGKYSQPYLIFESQALSLPQGVAP